MESMMVLICGYTFCLFMALLGGTILWKMWQGEIDLKFLISEANGHASMSRLQLLIFTFVIALSLFLLVARPTSTGFPDINQGVLTLLGISASTYAVGKGISYSRDEGVSDDEGLAKKRAHELAIASTQTVQTVAVADADKAGANAIKTVAQVAGNAINREE